MAVSTRIAILFACGLLPQFLDCALFVGLTPRAFGQEPAQVNTETDGSSSKTISGEKSQEFRRRRQFRAVGMAALTGIVLLAVAGIGFIWIGARFTRRFMGKRLTPTAGKVDWDDWANKPIQKGEQFRKEGDSPQENG